MNRHLALRYVAARRRNPLVPAAVLLAHVKSGDRYEQSWPLLVLAEAEATIIDLLHQIEQMRGLFDDEDHSIADAISDASGVLRLIASVRQRYSRRR